MRTFTCHCGNMLYFENTRCLGCDSELGVVLSDLSLYSLEPVNEYWRPQGQQQLYKKCRNYAKEKVCNWLIPAEDHNVYCSSCRLNQIIPNLGNDKNRQLWRRIESAKRRLIYTLIRLNLPIESRHDNPDKGLAFKFMEDQKQIGEFTDRPNGLAPVMTGHKQGVITINIAEADHLAREVMRTRMNEAYRTLLGHFRHEIGHYYWTELVEPEQAVLDAFRQLFGDERADYSRNLQQYYKNGPPADWSQHYISAYASSHPWEDWAETWAHYMHIVDTLETAQHQGFHFVGSAISTPLDATVDAEDQAFNEMIDNWLKLSVTLNELNRSMGLRDAYPFNLSEQSIQKLRFIYTLIHHGL